jgi:hypothetical protein
MEVMHAGFAFAIRDWIVEHIYIVVWWLMWAFLLRMLLIKTYLSKPMVVIIATVVSLVALRLMSREWFESFVFFWRGF